MQHKFNVGDRVKTICGLGTVKRQSLHNDREKGPYHARFYAVELDNRVWGHDCEGLTEESRGYWESENQMTLVTRAKPAKTFAPHTQCGQILAHLLSGKTLTRITADHLYRVASLTRRIKDLKDAGHKIISTTKVDPTGRTYVEYSMRKGGRV